MLIEQNYVVEVEVGKQVEREFNSGKCKSMHIYDCTEANTHVHLWPTHGAEVRSFGRVGRKSLIVVAPASDQKNVCLCDRVGCGGNS